MRCRDSADKDEGGGRREEDPAVTDETIAWPASERFRQNHSRRTLGAEVREREMGQLEEVRARGNAVIRQPFRRAWKPTVVAAAREEEEEGERERERGRGRVERKMRARRAQGDSLI